MKPATKPIRDLVKQIEGGLRGQPLFPAGLTIREVEVLRLVARGQTDRAIAEELTVSENTIYHHVRNITSKTGGSNRTQAAVWAAVNGLIENT
ncbi:MAG: LuxR C-terminal-related transcriptional regulator [Chloroflexi bacterium]|nr:LuxR C-terminal-related transcriptional regulator [Chloroflexota bacterium]